MACQGAKSTGASLRPLVSAYAKPVTMTGQCGMGWHGSGCDIAHLAANAVAESATVLGNSYAMIFVDIKAAYDSTLRRLAMPTSVGKVWTTAAVTAVGFSAAEAEEMAADVTRLTEWGRAPEPLPSTLSMLARSV